MPLHCRPSICVLILLVAGLVLGGSALPEMGTPPDDVRTQLRVRVDVGQGDALQTVAAGERIRAREMVARHYRRTAFDPAWTSPDGPTPQADSLLVVLRDAPRDGLRPTDYHVGTIDNLAHQLRAQRRAGQSMDARMLADFDLLCTDAFLLYSAHLSGGRVDPVAVVPSWTLDRRQEDLLRSLQEVLSGTSVREILTRLRPPQPAYAAFRRTLAHYRTLAQQGGWPSIPAGPTLTEGTTDERVPHLRHRLQATGDLSAGSVPDFLLFDAPLRQAVGRFQERHGLDVDGVVGSETWAAMNVPVEDRIRQIEVNLERWRWLPQSLGNPHVLVNIADYWLRVVEDGHNALQMRVVAGTQYRQTPIFSDEISYLVFNPYWHVPHSIATEDKLPAFQKDPALASRFGFEVLDGWEPTAQPIDPATIPWDSLSASNFPYRLRQRPGPANALGTVKFMFPNAHNVYLHDTPTRADFRRTARPLSSGCIRVEYPRELALYLLQHNEEWTEERIRAVGTAGVEQAVVLRRAVPVHLLYWTAWMENDDSVHFRHDIYGRDDAVARALAAPPAPHSVVAR